MAISPIDIAGIGLGAWSSFGAQAEARRAARRAEQMQNQALNLQERNFYDNLQLLRDMESQGAFNTEQRNKALLDAFDLARSVESRNQAGAAKTLGYRVGDSVPIQNLNAASQAAQLQRTQLQQNLMDEGMDRRMRAQLALSDPTNFSNSLMSIGVRNADMARQDELAAGQGTANWLNTVLSNPNVSGWLNNRAFKMPSRGGNTNVNPSWSNPFEMDGFGGWANWR